MDIYELPDGRVVTTGSFSVAEWDEYVASQPKSKREALAASGPANEPGREEAVAAQNDSTESESAPVKTTTRSSSRSSRTSSAKGK